MVYLKSFLAGVVALLAVLLLTAVGLSFGSGGGLVTGLRMKAWAPWAMTLAVPGLGFPY